MTASPAVLENSTAVTTVTATDADTTTPTISIVAGGDSGFFVLDPSTHALAFASAPDFEAPADSDHDNVYDVTIQVADPQGNTDTQTLHVTVTNVGGVTVLGGDDTGAQVAENGLAVKTVEANSLDTNPLSFSFAGGADAARFTIDPTTGALAFLVAPDRLVEPDSRLSPAAQTATLRA